MRLTNFSDCALRVLVVAAVRADRPDHLRGARPVCKISRAHLMEVVNQLARAGFLKAVRGGAGGLTFTNSRGQINPGDLVPAPANVGIQPAA